MYQYFPTEENKMGESKGAHELPVIIRIVADKTVLFWIAES